MRYSTPEEMAFYMGPPLCRALKNNEIKIPGDVGAIRSVHNGKQEESHGFIYISENLVYSKNGYNKDMPYALQPPEEVFDTYQVPHKPECRQNEIDLKTNCKGALSYFRCISLDEYLKQKKDVPKILLKTFKDFSKFEGCLQKDMIGGTVLTSEAKKGVLETMAGLSAYLDQELKNKNSKIGLSDETTFLLGDLELRLESVSTSIHDLHNESVLHSDFDISRESLEEKINKLIPKTQIDSDVDSGPTLPALTIPKTGSGEDPNNEIGALTKKMDAMMKMMLSAKPIDPKADSPEGKSDASGPNSK